MIFEIPLHLPRHACGPREVARPFELWRLCQDAATEASLRVGWTPQRYREAGVSFIVASMAMVHHAELPWGSAALARTWVRDFRRETLTRRQVEIHAGGGLVAEAIQQWVHVTAAMSPQRASPELLAAFAAAPGGPPAPELPAWTPRTPRALPPFHFQIWQGWQDPLGHVNHPDYLAWADEGVARLLAAAGADPQRGIAVAEQVRFRSGAVSGEAVRISPTLVGQTDGGAAVFQIRMDDGGDRIYATATLIRAHLDHELPALLG